MASGARKAFQRCPTLEEGARSLDVHSDQTLDVYYPGKGLDLGPGSFLQPKAMVEVRRGAQLRAVSYQHSQKLRKWTFQSQIVSSPV